MGEKELLELSRTPGISQGRLRLAAWIDSPRVQHFSTMQELSLMPEVHAVNPELEEVMERMDADLKILRSSIERLRGNTRPTGNGG